MNEKSYGHFYARLYGLFENETPLKSDCGAVCGKACCSGDGKTGMLLFPGEKTSLNVFESEGRKYAVCPGTCNRSERPLSCRIFPFFPVIDAEGAVCVTIDPRGAGICPLVRNAPDIAFNTAFLRRVLTAGKALARHKECRNLMIEVTEEINDTLILSDMLEVK